MQINGHDYTFEFLTGAYDDIAKLCPGEDINNLGKLMTDSKSFSNYVHMAVILSKWSEKHKKYLNPEYEPHYLTEDDCNFLSVTETMELAKAVNAAIEKGFGTLVKAEPAKAKGKNAQKAG